MRYYKQPLLAVAFVLITLSVTAFTFVHDQQPFKAKEEKLAVRETTWPKAGYDFSRPAAIRELPEILMEVSGLTELDNNTLACVQDEDGIVFIYDLKKQKIARELEFAGSGDYEGITRVGNSLYVLRSDGMIYEIDDYRSDKFKVTSYETDLPVKESEGLGFDADNNRLLIAGKSKTDDDNYKDMKVVYGFDLALKQVAARPVLAFDEGKIQRAHAEHGVEEDGKKEDKGPGVNPSALAVHPVTDQMYVLSSRDHLLYVFDRDSEVLGIYPLNKKEFAQPEGITFMDNGDMFISNEGKKGAPTLMYFRYVGVK